MKKTKLLSALFLLIFTLTGFSSCNEAIGPIGPQGEQGIQGEAGNGVSSIELTSKDGLVDTYTITYTDGSTTTFTVTNGKDGKNGEQGIQGEPGINGHTPIITIENGNWYIDGVDTSIKATCDEKESNWAGKDAIFIGDSITNGVGTDKVYYEFIQEQLNLNSAIGYGVSGSCFSSKSDYGYSNSPLTTRYNNIPSSDLIMVFMGTNDYGHETPIGSINDTEDVSFYGAVNKVIHGLINKNPTSSIVFVTPLHRYGFGTSKILNKNFTYDYLPNGRGHSLKDYRDAIMDVCECYSVPVIDLYGISGLNPCVKNIKDTYVPDGLHPNEKGHERIASIMCNYLENIYVGQKSEGEIDINKEDTSMQYGNRFVSSFTDHNRASSTINLYLEEGQIVTLLDNEKYKWALAGAENQTSNIKTHGYYPESAWSSIPSYTITQSGYYGVLLMTTDGSEFDFENDPNSNNILNYIIIE